MDNGQPQQMSQQEALKKAQENQKKQEYLLF